MGDPRLRLAQDLTVSDPAILVHRWGTVGPHGGLLGKGVIAMILVGSSPVGAHSRVQPYHSKPRG